MRSLTTMPAGAQAMRTVVRGVGGLSHAEWRSFHNERKTQEARGFVDGDLAEQFVDLARPQQEEVLAQEKTAGLDSESVLERVGGGDDVVERTLGAEVRLCREEDQEWMRCGVITKQAEWVAEHVVGMGRRKGQWLQVVVRGMQRTCALLWSAVFRVRSNCGCSTAG